MYIRMTIVDAVEMTRREYCESRGWAIPANEDPNEIVVQVTYPDGYVSMCPLAKFRECSVSVPEGCTTFGYAISECLYHGKRIKRSGWNGIDQYVEHKMCEVTYPETSTIIPSYSFIFHGKNRITGETNVQVGWLASQADMAACDWVILD